MVWCWAETGDEGRCLCWLFGVVFIGREAGREMERKGSVAGR